MKLQLINQQVKQLKTFILNIVQDMIEPSFWDEFLASIDPAGSQNYFILNHDLPIIRDLKAFINMLSAVERVTDNETERYPLLERYSLLTIFIVKKIDLMEDFLDFHRNYKIYMATNSILTHYWAYAKELTLTTILPQLIVKMNELNDLCTSANLEKIADFFIEQVLLLEQYQENYLRRKQTPIKPSDVDKKDDKSEYFIATLVKTNEYYLRKIYKEKYDIHFITEANAELKLENKPESIPNYYIKNTKDTDTIKHIKLLLNGIIGVKKLLDDQEGFQNAGMIYSMTWMATFIKDLRRTYFSFREFDYQAIIAEQANPFTIEIKNQLKSLNEGLEVLACTADRFEQEFRLKEGTLLRYVQLCLQRYNQITAELCIPIDYIRQKNLYYKSRQLSRESYMREINAQISDLKNIMIYRNLALMDIPYKVLLAIQAFIEKYNDDICMDHDRLATYKKYLIDSLEVKRNLKTFIKSQLEYIANRCGLTIHYETMMSLNNRLLYLENQKSFLDKRFHDSIKYFKNNPYTYFELAEMSRLGQQNVILEALKKQITTLNSGKEKLLAKTGVEKKYGIMSVDEKLKPTEVKPPEFIKPRLANQIKLITDEYKFFSSVAEEYEKTKTLPPLEMKDKNLTPESIFLLQEISQMESFPEHSSIKLA